MAPEHAREKTGQFVVAGVYGVRDAYLIPARIEKQWVSAMSDLNVRIEKLAAMRVASVRVLSEHPEAEAWERLKAWAEPRGLLRDPREHSVFGFNNPSPLPGQKVYGYEFWMRVGPEAQSEGPVEVKEVAGGKFAVMTHRGYPSPQAWKQLWEWARSSGHRWRKSHELEKMLEPSAREDEMTFELYLPIED